MVAISSLSRRPMNVKISKIVGMSFITMVKITVKLAVPTLKNALKMRLFSVKPHIQRQETNAIAKKMEVSLKKMVNVSILKSVAGCNTTMVRTIVSRAERIALSAQVKMSVLPANKHTLCRMMAHANAKLDNIDGLVMEIVMGVKEDLVVLNVVRKMATA